jgi:hypothetical protein
VSMYYDMDGKPLGPNEWSKSFSADDRIIKQETLPNGRYVSTVWLGIDHRFGDDGPPLIFETMLFDAKDSKGLGEDLDMDRYSTHEEAVAGHQRMVEKWSGESSD